MSLQNIFINIWSENYIEITFAYISLGLLLLTFIFSYLLQGRWQKVFLCGVVGLLLACGLEKEILLSSELNKIELLAYVFMTLGLLPVFYMNYINSRVHILDHAQGLQHLLLRLGFVVWAQQLGSNVIHYDLFQRFVLEFGIAALCVFVLYYILRKKIIWSHAQQTVLSLFVFSMSLHSNDKLVGALILWFLIIFVNQSIPKSQGRLSEVIIRLELGATGGWLQILGLLFLLASEAGTVPSMVWIAVFTCMGLTSWQVPLFNTLAISFKRNNKFWVGLRLALVALNIGVLFLLFEAAQMFGGLS